MSEKQGKKLKDGVKKRALYLMVGIMVIVPNLMFSQTLGNISGKYTDSNGSAMRMSSIILYNSQKNLVASTLTGTDGNFTFSGLQPGNYYLQFSKSGAPDVWYGGGNGQTVTVGNANVTVNFQYPQGINITGKYTDTNGSAMRMSSIILYNSQKNLVASTLTGTDGSFTFSGLQPGNYYLQFSKSGAPDVWYGGGNGQAVTVGNEVV